MYKGKWVGQQIQGNIFIIIKCFSSLTSLFFYSPSICFKKLTQKKGQMKLVLLVAILV